MSISPTYNLELRLHIIKKMPPKATEIIPLLSCRESSPQSLERNRSEPQVTHTSFKNCGATIVLASITQFLSLQSFQILLSRPFSPVADIEPELVPEHLLFQLARAGFVLYQGYRNRTESAIVSIALHQALTYYFN
ncbi:hypothetical protein DPSP01_010803 [Paraphaeosphaeria sporulosa]